MFKVRNSKPKPGRVTDAQICEAIRQHKVVECVYIGEPVRRIHPHCHGHSHEGHEVLSAYQVEGPSVAGWKMFDVPKLVAFRITDAVFTPQPDFNPESPGMSQVHCRL